MSAEERLDDTLADALNEDHVKNGYTLGFVEREEHRRMAPFLRLALDPRDLLSYAIERLGREEVVKALGLYRYGSVRMAGGELDGVYDDLYKFPHESNP